jgi:hypothetical protein
VVEGPDTGKEFDLSGAATVGRDPSAGVSIDDPEASREHASLTVAGTTVTVQDLGSTNGTFVNGERLSAARELSETDKLRIGTTVFELRVTGAEDATRVGTLPDPADLQATAPRQVPDFASAPPPSGPPGGAGGIPGGVPVGGPPLSPSMPPPGPPPGGPPPGGAPPPAGGSPPPPAYAPPTPGGPPAPYYSGAIGAPYPVTYEVDYPQAGISRWRCFFQWLLLIPHFFVLWFVWIGAALAFIGAWFAIIFTGRYPAGIFNFLVGALRWGARVNGYYYLMTEEYPPFSLEEVPHPVRVRIAYPEGGIARWRPFAHYFMAFPHIIVLYVLWIGAAFALLAAWFAILFTRQYPPGIFNFVNGVVRWQLRVQAFILLTTEQYPPFSLD